MEHSELVTVPASVATDLLALIDEARQLGNVVVDLVNRAELALTCFDGCLTEQMRSSDLAFGASAEAAGIGELYQALGTIADTANRI